MTAAAVMERKTEPTDFPVTARLFAGAAKVEMNRGAALHLFRLLQRYNWCLADVGMQEARWRQFWRSITSVERTLLCHFVRAHCGGRIGVRMRVEKPPVDFELYEDDPSPVSISPSTEAEFRRVLDGFYRELLSPAEVKAAWKRRCPREFAVLEANDQADAVLAPATRWVADEMERQIVCTLATAAGCADCAQWVAAILVSALASEIEDREKARC